MQGMGGWDTGTSQACKNPVKVCNKLPESEHGLQWEDNPHLLPQTEGIHSQALLLEPPRGPHKKGRGEGGRPGKAPLHDGVLRGGVATLVDGFRGTTPLGNESPSLWEKGSKPFVPQGTSEDPF